jgi:hypothetical protein
MIEKKPDMAPPVRRSRPAPEPQFVPMEPPPETLAKPVPLPEPEPVTALLDPAPETPPAKVEPVITKPQTLRSDPPLPPPRTRVVVTDIHIEFWSMVVLMVKAAFAVLPALFIIIGICLFFINAFTGFGKYR